MISATTSNRMPSNFFQTLLKTYQKTPHLSKEEVIELEGYLKKHKIKKNQVCLLIDIQYKAFNAKQRKKTLPRILLDFFKLGEKAEGFEKVMDLAGEKK
jgi:hypothetical protein